MLRDGVTPSRAKEVAEKEISELKNCMQQMEVDNDKLREKKSLTYIMLNKKSNLKLFNYNSRSKDYEGCQPGTVVDDVIANGNGFREFFMISQLVRQGTASATHYNIMYDDYKSEKSENDRRRDYYLMMYKLCHLYYNWTGGIKVPAPCQYSRRLAYMVGEKLTDRSEVYIPGRQLWEDFRSLYFL
jgi:aubergine-like protein